MPQISKIKYSDIQEAKRFDAEYFKPFNLLAEKLITTSNFSYLEKLGKFIIGPFGSTVKVEDYVEEKEYKYIRGKDIKNGVLIDVDNSAITKVKFDSLSKYHLKNNDVLITVVGTLGNVAIYRDSFGPAIFSCKSTIFRSNKINPEFLMIFLDTKYGRSLLMRNERGAIQKGFNLPDLKKILVPIFSDLFYQSINDMVLLSYKKQTQSKLLYKEAEDILLKELGLLNYEIKHTLAFGTTKKEIDEAGRYDSEYFQPKYKEIIKKVENYSGGFDLVENQFKQNTILSKKDKEYYNYIEISNVNTSNGEIVPSKIFSGDVPVNGKRKLFKNDLLISKVRPYRGAISFIDFDTDNLLGSGAFTVLQEKTEYKKEVLMIFLKTVFIKELLLRYNCGTSYPVIKDEDILNLKIPLIDSKIQKQIAEKVQESHKLRKESKDLLEEAKRKVEEEIEKR